MKNLKSPIARFYHLFVFALLFCQGASAKDIVFQDDFARQGSIFGTAPAPINDAKAAWGDNRSASGWTTDGSSLVIDKLDLVGLPFDSASVPESAVVTLAADLEVKTEWAMVGFSASNNPFDKDQGAFASVTVRGDGTISFGKGGGPDVLEAKSSAPGQSVHIEITLDYSTNSATAFADGNKIGSFSYGSIPPFSLVMVTAPENSAAHVRHFSLALDRKDSSPIAITPPAGSTPVANAPPVFILGGDHESTFASEWLDGVKQSATAAGFTVQTITSADLSKNGMPAEGILIVHRRSDLLDALPAVMDHMRKGGALWLAGSEDYYNPGPDKTKDTSDINRLLEGGSLHLDPKKLAAPFLTWTASGQKMIPLAATKLSPAHVAFLSADQSMVDPYLPSWVRITPLLEVRYKYQNWVNLEDTFTGWPMVLLEHTAGPFKGARVLYSGFAIDGKLFNPHNENFYPIVAGSLEALAKPVDVSNVAALDLPQPRPMPQRSNYFTTPHPSFAPLDFGLILNKVFWEDLDTAGFNGVHVGIPWITGVKDPDPAKIVDWAHLDDIMRQAKEHKKAVIVDPYAFEWFQGIGALTWAGNQSIHNPQFSAAYHAVMTTLAERYKDNPSFVAAYVTPNTGYSMFAVDRSTDCLNAWHNYLTVTKKWSLEDINKRYGLSCASINDVPQPSDDKPGTYNSGPAWADFIAFQLEAVKNFNFQTIDSMRKIIPDLPLLMRGGYFDVAIGMDIASHYTNVASHCECIETSSDIEGYYRGYGARFHVPYSAENGWPTIRGGPLRINSACYLLGGYTDFFYAFGGATGALPSLPEFARLERLADTLRQDGVSYGHSDLAILNADTTLFAHNPPDIFKIEFTRNIQFMMEKLGFTYEMISAQFPRWDGLRVIIDSGMNLVLTRETAQELTDWIKNGGTFIAYPDSGKTILEGDTGGLSAILGVDLHSPDSLTKPISLGKGTIIVLPSVPDEKSDADMKQLDQLFTDQKVRRDFLVEPYVNQASYTAKGKKYLIVANKTRAYVGAFFHESQLPVVEKQSHDIPLTITPQFTFSKVRNIGSAEPVQVADGKVQVTLKANDYTVIEFTIP